MGFLPRPAQLGPAHAYFYVFFSDMDRGALPPVAHASAAAKNSECALLEELLKTVNANAADQYGFSLLMSAAKNLQVGAAALLVKNGADVNQVAQSGWTALHYALSPNEPHGEAAVKNRCKLVTLLASPSTVDAGGTPAVPYPLTLAAQLPGDQVDVVVTLFSQLATPIEDALTQAVKYKNWQIARVLAHKLQRACRPTDAPDLQSVVRSSKHMVPCSPNIGLTTP